MAPFDNLVFDEQALAEDLLEYAYLTRGPEEEPFKLASGKTSREYFDCKRATLNGGTLIHAAAVLQGMVDDVDRGLDGLAAVPLGGVPLAVVAAMREGDPLPIVIARAAKDHGTKSSIEGPFAGQEGGGRLLALIEDVVTSAGSSIKVIRELREAGYLVRDLICLVDREAGGREALAAEEVTLHAAFTISQLKEAL